MQLIKATAATVLVMTFSSPLFAQMNPNMDSSTMPSGMGKMAMKSAPNAAQKPYDLQFIDTMAMHHQGAIEMAKLADSHSGHDQLKVMAKKMIEDQQAEIKELHQWKQDWYAGKGDAANMKMPGMKASMQGMSMDKLAASNGNAFDLMFLDMMIKHHTGAIEMAKEALKKSRHPEIKEMSNNIIQSQTEEIGQMKKWKAAWMKAQ